jgi:hypothetical protein
VVNVAMQETARTGYINSLSHTLCHAEDEGARAPAGAKRSFSLFRPVVVRRSAKFGALNSPHAVPHRQTSLHHLNFSSNFFFIRGSPQSTEKKKGFHEATDYRFRGVIGQFAHISLRSFFRFPRFLSVNPPDLFYSCVTTVTVSTTTKIHFLSRSSGSVPTHPRLSRSHVLRMVCWV